MQCIRRLMIALALGLCMFSSTKAIKILTEPIKGVTKGVGNLIQQPFKMLSIPGMINDLLAKLKVLLALANLPWFLILFLAFVLGVMTSFLPCIYPMIPITASILQTQQSPSLLHNFFLSITYVLGVATIHATLGYLSASMGILLGSWLANPWFAILLIAFFLYFALSMFGFYELYIPRFLQSRGDVKTEGSFIKCYLLGIVSGTVASPCLAPPLAALIGIVAHLGKPAFGFLTLFMFSLGMGVPLIIIGTFSGAVALLPHAGPWMLEMKRALGFMLLGTCVYFLHSFLPPWIILIFYALIVIAAGLYYFMNSIKCTSCSMPTTSHKNSKLMSSLDCKLCSPAFFFISLLCIGIGIGLIVYAVHNRFMVYSLHDEPEEKTKTTIPLRKKFSSRTATPASKNNPQSNHTEVV